MKEYCDSIRNEALSRCEISAADLTLTPNKHQDNASISFELKDGQKWLCLRKIIEETLNIMPFTTKGIFSLMLEQLDEEASSMSI
jgi:hypothetical protein